MLRQIYLSAAVASALAMPATEAYGSAPAPMADIAWATSTITMSDIIKAMNAAFAAATPAERPIVVALTALRRLPHVGAALLGATGY